MQLAVEPARQRILDVQELTLKFVPHRLLKHEAERAGVCPDSVGVAIADELHLMRPANLEVKPLQRVVDQRGENLLVLRALGFLRHHVPRDVEQRRSEFDVAIFIRVFAINPYFVHIICCFWLISSLL